MLPESDTRLVFAAVNSGEFGEKEPNGISRMHKTKVLHPYIKDHLPTAHTALKAFRVWSRTRNAPHHAFVMEHY